MDALRNLYCTLILPYLSYCACMHAMKVVKRVLEKRLCRIVTVDKMQFGLMPERGIIDAV